MGARRSFLVAALLLSADALAAEGAFVEVRLGHSAVVQLDAVPSAWSVTDEDIATATPLASPQTLLVQGKAIGTTDLVLVVGDEVHIIDLTVQRDLAPLRRAVDEIVADQPETSSTP